MNSPSRVTVPEQSRRRTGISAPLCSPTCTPNWRFEVFEYAAASQLVGYPTQFPSVTMIDWPSGQPNPRYWMLKLLKDHFGPGDKLFEAKFQPNSMGYMLYARGFETPQGKRKILLVNKRDRSFEVSLPDAQGAKVEFLDQSTGFQPPFP